MKIIYMPKHMSGHAQMASPSTHIGIRNKRSYRQKMFPGLLSVVCLLLAELPETTAQRKVPIVQCESGQYMDITNFKCYDCSNPPNAPTDSALATGLQARIPDPSSNIQPYSDNSYTVATACKCTAGWIVDPSHYSTLDSCENQLALRNYWCNSFTCTACLQASSLDNAACNTCDPITMTFDSTTGRCECIDDDNVIVEHDTLIKTCEPCPNGSVVRRKYLNALRADASVASSFPEPTENDDYVCEECPHVEMQVSDGLCLCALPGTSNPLWTSLGVEGFGNGPSCALSEELAVVNENDIATIVYYHVSQAPIDSPILTRRRLLRGVETFRMKNDRASNTQDGALVVADKAEGRMLQEGARKDLGDYTSYTVANSILFEHYYQAAGTGCRYLRDEKDLVHCEALANLCVLQHYDESTPACQLYALLQTNREVWQDIVWNWKLTLPWLQYRDAARIITTDVSIEMRMSFDMKTKTGTYDYLDFVLARYAINGTFLGWSNVTSEFEYCSQTLNQAPSWTMFGYGSQRVYGCNLLNLINYFPEPVMYDMYVVDHGDGGNLQPVPVRNINLRNSGRYPNDNDLPLKEDDDLLTRRFFLYDQVSSKESVAGTPKIVRFAKEIYLTIKVQESDVGRIYPPLLEIFYEDRLVSEFFEQGTDERGIPPESATTVQVSFTVDYTQDYVDFWSSATMLFGLCITFMALIVGLRLNNWSRRNSRLSASDGGLDGAFFLRGFVYLLATFSQVVFWYLFVYCMYFFVFFKLQSNIHLLLPRDRPFYGSNNDYFAFEFMLVCAFFGQIICMMEILYVQTNCDVFLVDWEKPRGRVSSKRGGSDGSKTKFAPISVWRTLFMANEWNELQTARSYSVEFSFLAIATLLLGFDLQYLATPRPDLDLSPSNLNMVLRFANTTFWYLMASYGQIFYRWAIHERYFAEPGPQSFVDLCTMAKLSVFILDEEYHGYYLHCRSQHEYSDGNMLEISRQLRQEAEGLTTDRGLPGGPAGVQTYELYLSANWKKQYNHIFRTMMSQELAGIHADKSSFLARVFGRKSGKVPAERLVRASRKLNAFLRGFVDQTTSEFPSVHREQTFVHQFLHVPPESTANSKDTLFLPDKKLRFTKVLLYGQEWNLILFNILSLAFFDYVYENTSLAIFLAYLLDCVFVALRYAFGNANVAAKTLVDDRFLK